MTRSRLSRWRRRELRRPRIIRSGRSPHELLVCVTAFLIGVSGLLLPVSISPAIDEAFPDSLENVYFAGLVLSSAVTLLGVARHRVEGLLLERIGLLVQACFFAAYGIAILSNRGFPSLGFALIPLCFTVANVIRVGQIRSDLAYFAAAPSASSPSPAAGDQ